MTLSGFDLPTVYGFYLGAFGYLDCRIRAPIEPYIPNIDGEYILTGNGITTPCVWSKLIRCAYVFGREDGHAIYHLGVLIRVYLSRLYATDPFTGLEPGLYYWVTVDVTETSPTDAPWNSAGGPLFAGFSDRIPFDDEEGIDRDLLRRCHHNRHEHRHGQLFAARTFDRHRRGQRHHRSDPRRFVILQ